MGTKPKAQDYKPSEADKASAAVAKAEYDYFKKNYDPLLQQMRDKALTADYSTTLRGRANADTMQALTSQPSYAQTQSNTLGGDMAQALQGQLGVASAAGKDVSDKMKSNVLGIARGQAADAQTGMATAGRLGTSTALARAQANQAAAQSKLNAAVQLGSALGFQGLKNIGSGGSFFTPNKASIGDGGKIISTPASGFTERLQAAQQMNSGSV